MSTPRPEGPLVIKIGGSTLEDVASLGSLWRLVVGAAAARPIVLVHGGGKAVDALLQRLGLPVERRDGLRVTPDDQVDLVAGVLAGAVNKRLVGAINAAGGRAVGLCLGDGGMVGCEQADAALGRVGRVTGGEAAVVRTLLGAGYLPVISSIGIDAGGGLLNVNADDAAAALAGAVGASRLVLLTDVEGIRGGDGVVRSRLASHQIDAMIAAGEITGGMIVKARSALAAAVHTRAPVVIVSGQSPQPLRDLLTGRPAGTTIEE
jgi:acetylglutamate kinase